MSPKITRIGITGGIGAGKSEVGKLFAKVGIPVFNLDTIGQELCDTDQELLAKLSNVVGHDVVKNGKLDRDWMREKIFGDRLLKKEVEAILHPAILKRFFKLSVDKIEEGAKLIICEAALLIEGGLVDFMDKLIVVIAPKELRSERVLARDGMSETIFGQILNSQVTDDVRREKADFIIENRGDFVALQRHVDKLVKTFDKNGWF